MHLACMPVCCRFAFVEGITSGSEDGTDSLPHLTNVKPDPDGPASKPAAGEGEGEGMLDGQQGVSDMLTTK